MRTLKSKIKSLESARRGLNRAATRDASRETIEGLASLPASRRGRCPACNAPPRAPDESLCYVCSAVRRADAALHDATRITGTPFIETSRGGVSVQRAGATYTVVVPRGAGEPDVVADGTADEVRPALAWLLR